MHTYIEESHCALGIHTILFASYTLVTSKVKKKKFKEICGLLLKPDFYVVNHRFSELVWPIPSFHRQQILVTSLMDTVVT